MRTELLNNLASNLEQLKIQGLYKGERSITSQQQADITIQDGKQIINFCANNYLGLTNNPDLIKAAQAGGDQYGFGMASVRFICGIQELHKKLEADSLICYRNLQIILKCPTRINRKNGHKVNFYTKKTRSI